MIVAMDHNKVTSNDIVNENMANETMDSSDIEVFDAHA